MSSSPHVAIAGATGTVGEEMLKCLEQRDFPVGELTLLASARSAGRKLRFRDREVAVQELGHDSFQGVDIALFSAGGSLSLEFGPSAAAAGAVMIDNSSAFRMDPEVPLVVPEVNPEAAKTRPKGIIANPNCTTIVTIMGLNPLHRKFGLKSVIASSYQAVSGSGQAGIMELSDQVRALSEGRNDLTKNVYPHQIAFNVLPHIDRFEEGGYTGEERKVMEETRKMLGLPDLAISATCVRVPVVHGHSESVMIETAEAIDADQVRSLLMTAPGVALVDEPAYNRYPMPIEAAGRDEVLVGRIRRDESHPRGLALWLSSDNLRKGAATNAVQIAESIVTNGWL